LDTYLFGYSRSSFTLSIDFLHILCILNFWLDKIAIKLGSSFSYTENTAWCVWYKKINQPSEYKYYKKLNY